MSPVGTGIIGPGPGPVQLGSRVTVGAATASGASTKFPSIIGPGPGPVQPDCFGEVGIGVFGATALTGVG